MSPAKKREADMVRRFTVEHPEQFAAIVRRAAEGTPLAFPPKERAGVRKPAGHKAPHKT